MPELLNQSGVGRGKITEVELTPSGFNIKRVCQDRFTPPAGPKNITHSIGRYLPLEQLNIETYTAFNMVGWKLGSVTVKSRVVYPAFDGKRLVVEVGCNTIIYLQISPTKKNIHHRFFLQKHKDFLFDITTRAVAAKVSRAAEPIVTIAKYEMYFLMGIFSTVSIPMWLIITGTDVTVSLVGLKHKGKAFRKLAKSILNELENIRQYAPTLHVKMMQIIRAEKNRTIVDTRKELPKKVITDKKAQAQTAGILYGKYAMAANPLTVWSALLTILIQAGVKSVSNIPNTYLTVLDKRYASKVRSLTNTNWYDLRERKQAISKIVDLLKNAKVPISASELEKIVKEVQQNPQNLQNSFINIMNAYKEFKRVIH